MIHKAESIKELLEATGDSKDPLVITPRPQITEEMYGSGSIDLRLGTWFLSLRQEKNSTLNVYDPNKGPNERQLTKYHYVPFGGSYILHPRSFVLGVTLEWIRLPRYLAAYVIGKSSWGRRGLIIATAAGVHPGFTGCITLELCNVGEVPIEIKPGMKICQIFMHSATPKSDHIDHTQFVGRRKPTMGSINIDDITRKLGMGHD